MSDPNYRMTALSVPAITRKTILRAIYSHWDTLAAAETFACRPGCADCCTQSVTTTSLEAALIHEHFAHADALTDLASLLSATDRTRKNIAPPLLMTTNEYVGRHLAGDPPEEGDSTAGDWDFAPCPFLHTQTCSIYPVRPFGCRAFASTESCRVAGHAVVPPHYPAMMTVIMQLIEHLDTGMPWGNFLDLLACQGEVRDRTFAVSRQMPGFLLAENERPAIDLMLTTLASQSAAGRTIGEWINAL